MFVCVYYSGRFSVFFVKNRGIVPLPKVINQRSNFVLRFEIAVFNDLIL